MSDDWKSIANLHPHFHYRKKFAILPVKDNAGNTLWLKKFYKKYLFWSHNPETYDADNDFIEFIENVPDEVYMIRKLADTL
jgi:hypothetical protein